MCCAAEGPVPSVPALQDSFNGQAIQASVGRGLRWCGTQSSVSKMSKVGVLP